VTHLPQIAAMGDQHLLIEKNIMTDRTFTSVEPLDASARSQELARMISGTKVTEASLRNAEELLAQAENWKRNLE
jgi:DNA repair protein RecN (Recombination protein N)